MTSQTWKKKRDIACAEPGDLYEATKCFTKVKEPEGISV
jgi:hypothetical protein